MKVQIYLQCELRKPRIGGTPVTVAWVPHKLAIPSNILAFRDPTEFARQCWPPADYGTPTSYSPWNRGWVVTLVYKRYPLAAELMNQDRDWKDQRGV